MFDHYSQIQDYIDGKLSGDTLKNFQAAMEADSDLRNIVENNDIYSNIADEIINKNISEKINIAQAGKKDSVNVVKLIISLVAISLLIGAVVLYFNKEDLEKGRAIYAEYYFEPSDTHRGIDSIGASDYACGKGHAYMEIDKIQKAKAVLLEDIKQGDDHCRIKSQYLLSLVLIQENDFDSAKIHLENILTQDQSDYSEKTQELLEKISEY